MIEPTLESIQAQLTDADRLIVVADNCTDMTAEVAWRASAEVIQRNDPDHRGKGYALSFGIEHLRDDPRDVVIIVDADCLLGADALAHLASALRRPMGRCRRRIICAPRRTVTAARPSRRWRV